MTQVELTNLKKGQRRLTKIFKFFDKVCRENGIKYWLNGGTLIGAVRHKGWIPHDADIDVSMFDSHRARVIAGLELMRMLYADDYVHEAELAEIKAICRAFKFPEPWVATMTEWAKRMAWTEEELEKKLVEIDRTERIFTNPTNRETEDYVSGRFG